MDMNFVQFVAWVEEECKKKHVGQFPLSYVLEKGLANDGEWYAEFGVCSGRTINILRAATDPRKPVLGFDTFTGLPERWRAGFEKGAFDRKGVISNVPDNTTIVKGLFQESLPALLPFFEGRKLALLHVDCDIYSSTAYVLGALRPCIKPGTVVVFDELLNYPGYVDHEMKALYEFLLETGYRVEVLAMECEGAQPVAFVIR